MSEDFVAALRHAMSQLRPEPAELTSDALEQLARHWALICRWNPRTNLTAITNNDEAALLHYADSLAVLPHLVPGSILDIGSGAGFPGVPLAIATGRPTTLLEPRLKRVSFLRTLKAELGLSQLEIEAGRSTDAIIEHFANVVTRATFSRDEDILACQRWVAPGGRLIALRAEGGDRLTDFIHERYQLAGKARNLALWSLAGVSVR